METLLKADSEEAEPEAKDPKEKPEEEPFQSNGGTSKAMRVPLHCPTVPIFHIPQDPYE